MMKWEVVTNYIHKFKNLKLIHNSDASEVWDKPYCIGGGVGINGRIEIDNCILNCKIQTAIDYHTDWNANNETNGQNTFDDSSKVIVNNCFSSSSTITCTPFSSSQLIKNQMYISNCLLSEQPFVNILNQNIGDNFEMKKWNIVTQT